MMIINDPTKRPMEGLYLRDCLKRLAEISVRADSLRHDLEPLGEDDIAAGAEPLTVEQISEELQGIATLATKIALDDLHATNEEWYAANDKIE
ncbi:hypothetical protein [Paracoccus albus]|uniref:hypothetical protein n=1 Tax=Paracoccus albus TaxID=3017784 RepID=UPI0022F12B86|nr:hypothetical protein [Paracoccus albus]WBU61788.1 hypothetical protein PAF20_07820 [Paracoccus albus]